MMAWCGALHGTPWDISCVQALTTTPGTYDGCTTHDMKSSNWLQCCGMVYNLLAEIQ